MTIDTKNDLLDKLSAIRETLTREYWQEHEQLSKREFSTVAQQMAAAAALGELARAVALTIEAMSHLSNVVVMLKTPEPAKVKK